ncbi:MAG: hypothetical protein HQL99_14320 [Magnetococcales bacterium]|nr:hypothetical protein [Magnetococcales bacterium]
MIPLPPLSSRARRLVRLLFPRLVIGFGLLVFITVVPPLEEGWSDDRVLLRLFVVAMFLMVIGYLWWLRTGRDPEWLVRVQCVIDPWLVLVLVLLTGGFHSPFLFLNGLVTLNAAFLLGRRGAMLTAGLILLLTSAALSVTTLLLGTPVEPAPVLLGGLVLHGAVYFLTAFLGGTLAQRAAGLQSAFERQTDSLADLAALHEQIVAAVPYGLILVNNQGWVRAANPGAGEFAPAEMTRGLTGWALRRIDPALAWAVEWAGGETVYVEVPTQGRILGLNVSFLRDRLGERIGALLVIRDLTPMKTLERELEERERLAWIGRMSAGMAHEIRNPLASILTAAHMLAPVDAREQRMLGIIREEVARVKQLTGDFLLFARGARPRRQPVGMAEFLADMEERARRDPRWGGRKMVMELADPGVMIGFDPDHLRQIFWNLLLNAAQAAPEGKRVVVRIAPLESGRVELVVQDDGPGVDPGILPRLTEPFFTTRPNGSGLGLAVVHHLAVLNGAALRLENAATGGLRVVMQVEEAYGGDSGL